MNETAYLIVASSVHGLISYEERGLAYPLRLVRLPRRRRGTIGCAAPKNSYTKNPAIPARPTIKGTSTRYDVHAYWTPPHVSESMTDAVLAIMIAFPL